MTLWHFTDEAGHAAIQHTHNVLLPQGEHGIVWLTSLDRAPVPAYLGLTVEKTAHRYVVADEQGIRPWLEAAHEFPPELQFQLELVPRVQPQHWFVATKPVLVRYLPL